jgi:hypothetical protein
MRIGRFTHTNVEELLMFPIALLIATVWRWIGGNPAPFLYPVHPVHPVFSGFWTLPAKRFSKPRWRLVNLKHVAGIRLEAVLTRF